MSADHDLPGYQLVNTVPEGVKVVGLTMFRDRVILATERGVYSMGAGEHSFTPVRLHSPRRWFNLRGFWSRVWERQ